MKSKKARSLWTAFISAVLVSTGFGDAPEVHEIDTAHSGAVFKIRHLINNVPGTIPSFTGTVAFDPANLEHSHAEAVFEVASINTNNDRRDDHLRNEDFFEVETYPTLHFRSTRFEAGEEENHYRIIGDLTIREITREVTLDAHFLGNAEGRDGQNVQGWEATTSIDRRDFGITFGQGLIGNRVNIDIFIQAHGS